MSLADKIKRLKTSTQRRSDNDSCEVNVGDLNDVLEEMRIVIEQNLTFKKAAGDAPMGQIWNILAKDASDALDTVKNAISNLRDSVKMRAKESEAKADALEEAARTVELSSDLLGTTKELATKFREKAQAYRRTAQEILAKAEKEKKNG